MENLTLITIDMLSKLGALRGRDVATLKVPELKRWLQCPRASTKDLKSDLVARYHNESPYINNDSYT